MDEYEVRALQEVLHALRPSTGAVGSRSVELTRREVLTLRAILHRAQSRLWEGAA